MTACLSDGHNAASLDAASMGATDGVRLADSHNRVASIEAVASGAIEG